MTEILDDTDEWAGFPDLTFLPPHARILFLLLLRRGADAVMVAAKLGVADRLAEGPLTADELAEATGTNASALRRVLLTSASLGIFRERQDGRFVLTEDADCLRGDAEVSLRDLAVHYANLTALNPFDELMETVRTGADAFDRRFGRKAYEYFADHPELAEPFNRAMTETTRMSAEAVAMIGDFDRFGVVADIGGGEGQLIGEIVRHNPGLHGVVFDFPDVTAGAPEVLRKLGVADRVTVESGDFRESLPHADAYLFHRVMLGWDDDQITRTLSTIKKLLSDRPDARLLIAEPVLPPPNNFHPGRMFDMEMMLNTGGRIRTEAEWRRLLTASGLEFVHAQEASPMITVLEVR